MLPNSGLGGSVHPLSRGANSRIRPIAHRKHILDTHLIGGYGIRGATPFREAPQEKSAEAEVRDYARGYDNGQGNTLRSYIPVMIPVLQSDATDAQNVEVPSAEVPTAEATTEAPADTTEPNKDEQSIPAAEEAAPTEATPEPAPEVPTEPAATEVPVEVSPVAETPGEKQHIWFQEFEAWNYYFCCSLERAFKVERSRSSGEHCIHQLSHAPIASTGI